MSPNDLTAQDALVLFYDTPTWDNAWKFDNLLTETLDVFSPDRVVEDPDGRSVYRFYEFFSEPDKKAKTTVVAPVRAAFTRTRNGERERVVMLGFGSYDDVLPIFESITSTLTMDSAVEEDVIDYPIVVEADEVSIEVPNPSTEVDIEPTEDES
jgi:hypothetical protein